jgi:hypothetical protein
VEYEKILLNKKIFSNRLWNWGIKKSFSYWGNANQKDTEILSHPNQIAIIKKTNNKTTTNACEDVG